MRQLSCLLYSTFAPCNPTPTTATPTPATTSTAAADRLRLNSVYYRRSYGIGWERIEAASVPDGVRFSPLHEQQRATYAPELRRLGLLG